MIIKKIKNLTTRLGFSLLVAGLLSFTLISCDQDEVKMTEPEPVAFVSIYQASPDAPALDILVDSRTINRYSFDYSDYTGYQRFYTGERTLSFGPHGADNVVVDTLVNLDENKAYSVFLAGPYAEMEALIFEDTSEEPAAGKAMVRMINLSPDVDEIDLVSTTDSTILVDNKRYKAAPEFIEVEAKPHNLVVTDAEGNETLLDVPNASFIPGKFYTVIVRGFQEPPVGNSNSLSAQIIDN